ncbi:hypothetical protein ACUYFE_04650 [Olegusella massiliensis]|uniref:hypothetical protein n=1 Tax=Olegusella massiliensis TaxID=1776381 RepID=UPI0040557460
MEVTTYTPRNSVLSAQLPALPAGSCAFQRGLTLLDSRFAQPLLEIARHITSLPAVSPCLLFFQIVRQPITLYVLARTYD